MRQTVAMPALSDTMSVGRLAKWLKNPGEPVKKGEPIAEIETDKAVMEVEAFYDGFLAGPLASVGADLPLGTPIAYIVDSPADADRTAAPAVVPTAAATPVGTAQVPHPTAPAASVPTAGPSGAVRATPYARALARDLGIDLAKIATGKAGPVGATDLLREAVRAPTANLEEGPAHRVARASSLREAVARNMIAGMATPTFRLTSLMALEPLQNSAKEHDLSLTLLLARACALTIQTHPLFNTVYTPAGLAQRDQVDIGIAVDIPEGLLTPVLRDVARRPLADLARDWGVLREKVKARRLTPQDYRGATFYISDLGVFPVVQSFDSIIPLGASAILSVGAARTEGAMFTLSCDHRVVFGADGARFLTTLGGWLSDPGKLVV